MKVSIFFNGQYPGIGASVTRTQNYEKSLRAHGVNVHVIPCTFKCTGYLMKRLERFFVLIKILPKVIIERKKSNVIFLYGHSWVTILVVKICLLFSECKIVLEVCEKPQATSPSWFYDLYPVKFINNVGTKYFAFKIVDGFVVISHALVDYVNSYKSKSSSLILIPIMVDTRLYGDENKSKIPVIRPYMVHSGLISDQKDGIINTVEAFISVCKRRNRNFHFYFTLEKGPKADIEKIKKLIRENSLEGNVHFLGELDQDELIDLQRNCSLVVLNKPLNDQNKYNFPTKLGEYLALGRPVIASQVGEMALYLKDNYNAVLLPDNSSDSIQSKINYVLDNEKKMDVLSKNARNLAFREFDSMINGLKLMNYFKTLTGVH